MPDTPLPELSENEHSLSLAILNDLCSYMSLVLSSFSWSATAHDMHESNFFLLISTVNINYKFDLFLVSHQPKTQSKLF